MAEKILVINTGSTSRKYALFLEDHPKVSIIFEQYRDSFLVTCVDHNGKKEEKISLEQYTNSLNYVNDYLLQNKFIENLVDIKKIAIRVVSPGDFFTEDHIIDKEYIERLENNLIRDPLHIKIVLDIYREIIDIFPKITIIGISDSWFHKTIPQYRRLYGIQREDFEKFSLYKYGYHGISVQSIIDRLKEDNILKEKLIICHLGGGSSITAISEGKSIENTMGYSPLEGLLMASRPGNIDPSVLFSLQEEKGLSIKELKHYLYRECGIKGISGGISDDLRTLLILESEGHQYAGEAVKSFIYNIKKSMGAMIALLNGVDHLIFTGSIGERSSVIRARVLSDMNHLGISVDLEKNKGKGVDFDISEDNMLTKISVIHNNEMMVIAKRAMKLGNN